jgi:hypothetical protein
MKMRMKITLYSLIILIFISCSNNKNKPISGLYYFPETCIHDNNNLTSKERFNCITVEFPNNGNRLILTELDSGKKPSILEYFIIKTENKDIIKIKFDGNPNLFNFFEVDNDGNLYCVKRNFGKPEWAKIAWIKQ